MVTRKMIVAIAVALCALSIHPATGIVQDGQGPTYLDTQAYAPDEIIVKFKNTVAIRLEQQLAQGTPAGQLRLSDSLDNLSRRHGVNNVQPLVKNFWARRREIENLKAKYRDELTQTQRHLLRRLRRAPKGARIPDLGRIYTIELEQGQSAPQAVADYRQDPDVEYAELDYLVSICSTEPNDPCYPVQWALANTGQMYPESGSYRDPPGTPDCDIDANEAWDITTGSSDIVVAVIDTGADYTHRDLQDNMWTDSNGHYGYDFFWDDNDPMDDHGHGTHCAGIIAADSNNGFDIAGVSWNAKIMAVKFLGPGGYGWTSDAAKAFYYAVDNGADVTSNSWGSSAYSQLLQDAIDYAYSQGVMTVAAAGNDNSSYPQYPADCNHVIAVAATDSNDDKASFSSYGEWVDLAAPGVDILSLRAVGTSLGSPQNDYLTVASGTSMACPHVSGACGLLLSLNPYMTPDDACDILTDPCSIDPIADGICWSDGRLNAYKALVTAVPSKGYISLDRNYYNCDSNVGISLADADLAGGGTQDVNVSTSGGDLETVTLTETASGIGVFSGQISTGSGDPCSQDGTLQVSDGETITATYHDANDGTGSSASPNDLAEVDCVDPNFVTDVNFTVVGPNVTVTFETDEYTLGRVVYGTDCNAPTDSVISWGASHAIRLREISPWTHYYFKVTATDRAGNQITDDNDANCYQFTTDGPKDFAVPADYNTIQEAIDASLWDGGTITVSQGNYIESIAFKAVAITLTSTDPNDWDVVAATTIDANDPRLWAVNFVMGDGPDSVLAGFRTINGHTGVRCGDGASPTIKNCIIEDNIYGVRCFPMGSRPTLINNIIRSNYEGVSGGFASGPVIRSNLFHDNHIGILCPYPLPGTTISNSTIVGNTSGVDLIGTAKNIANNCILWYDNDSLDNCSATYSCIEDANDANGTGNITDDPCFLRIYAFHDETEANGTTTTMIVADATLYEVNDVIEYDDDAVPRTVTDVNSDSNTVTFAGDPLDSNSLVETSIHNWGPGVTDVNEDYHVASDSPCINAGDPNADYSGQKDIDGDPRLMAQRVDMGVDEFSGIFNLDQEKWYDTIQAAIDDANETDSETIEVGPGIYYEEIDFNAVPCTLRSVEPNDWSVVANTVIDANSRYVYAVTFQSGEDQNSVLKGFTVRNSGYAGIVINGITTVCSPTIANCIIRNNEWGVECYYGSCVLENNIVYEHPFWGMSFSYTETPAIKNNLIYKSVYQGAGWYGTGIYFQDANAAALVRNNTIVGNDRGIWRASGTAPAISNCIIWDNANGQDLVNCTATYSCISDCNDANGTGNICGDANDPNFVDPNNDDYHLDANSPCIDAGDPNGTYTGEIDIDFQDRVMGDYIDMGGDEYKQ